MATFEHDGLTFDVIEGGPSDGPPVVLLHGFPQDATSWSSVADRLHAAGVRTLAPDQRGYSPRARPTGTEAYAGRHLVADVIALLDNAGLARAHIVGHDWGGAVAWQFAIRHPERVASLTVLSTPHPDAFARALRTPDQARRSWYMLAFQLPWLPERLMARGFARRLSKTGMPPAFADQYARRFARPGDLTGPMSWYRAAVERPGRGTRRAREQAPVLPKREGGRHTVSVPTTYVWGRDDFALGREAAEHTGAHVSGDYRFVELAAGHWLPETHPDEIAREVLDRIAAAPA
ncbi:MAG TPA: alpha/beta fold hydrolase [Dermatophilaceae bacterium]|nr:alpha/beta fold hydrolase [Dermatophilaceae bacterium]